MVVEDQTEEEQFHAERISKIMIKEYIGKIRAWWDAEQRNVESERPVLAKHITWSNELRPGYHVTHYRLVTPAPSRNIRVKPSEPVVVNMNNEEVTPAPKQFRPFASAEEWKPHFGRLLRSTKPNYMGEIVYAAPNAFDSQGFIDANARCTWDRAFANYVFDDDGSVCGVEVSE